LAAQAFTAFASISTKPDLVSYGRYLARKLARSAYFVDKILKGTKPADLSVELPVKLELAIELKISG
jgi:putative tryptophan/tyrosine transport system substrate-binding protein